MLSCHRESLHGGWKKGNQDQTHLLEIAMKQQNLKAQFVVYAASLVIAEDLSGDSRHQCYSTSACPSY